MVLRKARRDFITQSFDQKAGIFTTVTTFNTNAVLESLSQFRKVAINGTVAGNESYVARAVKLDVD